MILGFDTSGPYCAVSLFDGARLVADRHQEMQKGQAEALMPLIEDTLSAAGIAPAQLSAIGVGIGPGNFTGIRISVSAARGLALALGIPAIGVSLFDALSLDADLPCLVCLDARRGQVYLRRFGPDVTRGPDLVAPKDLGDWATPGVTVIGHDAERIAEQLGATSAPSAHSIAGAIARCAATRWQSPQPRPAPLYLRPADAAPSSQPAPRVL